MQRLARLLRKILIGFHEAEPETQFSNNYKSNSSSLNSWRSTDGALSAGASIISWRGGDSTIKSASEEIVIPRYLAESVIGKGWSWRVYVLRILCLVRPACIV